jgi:4-hydroxy-tetrahydrodipicolinate synthase
MPYYTFICINYMMNFKGTAPAIITPFTPKGEVDYQALGSLIEYWINGGVDFLVVLGTTGESVTLDKTEKKEVFEFVANQVKGRVPVVLGIGGNNTKEVIDSLGHYDLTKAQGILSVSPYYNKPTQDGIYAHYTAFAAECPLPIILYNVPGRTGSNVLANTTIRLAHEVENIVAVKEASGNMEQIMQIIADRPEGFHVLSGDDGITLPLIACGADGVISVVANSHPKEFSDMVRFALAGNYEKARELHYPLLKVIEHLFIEGNPAGVKAVMKIKGLCGDSVRLPLVNISEGLYEKIERMLK